MPKQIKKKFLAAVLIAVCANVLTANAGISNASGKCATPGTAREAAERAAAVFVGEITEISEADNAKIIEFAVERFWKGEKLKTQIIRISTGMRYSPSLAVGERYLVYAAKNAKDQLTTGRCSRTKLAEYADEDIRSLGNGVKP